MSSPATVSSVSPLTVTLHGSATAVPALCVASYTPVLNDQVSVDQQQSQAIILGGTTAPGSPPVTTAHGTVTGATTDGSGLITVTHGLPSTPSLILTSVNSTTTANERTLRTYARTATTFQIQCYYNGVVVLSNPGWGFDWFAEV